VRVPSRPHACEVQVRGLLCSKALGSRTYRRYSHLEDFRLFQARRVMRQLANIGVGIRSDAESVSLDEGQARKTQTKSWSRFRPPRNRLIRGCHGGRSRSIELIRSEDAEKPAEGGLWGLDFIVSRVKPKRSNESTGTIRFVFSSPTGR
jgi:hypothetical protein